MEHWIWQDLISSLVAEAEDYPFFCLGVFNLLLGIGRDFTRSRVGVISYRIEEITDFR